MDDEHRQALDQRKDLIESRARALAEEAVEGNAPWTNRLGVGTDGPRRAAVGGWRQSAPSPPTETVTPSRRRSRSVGPPGLMPSGESGYAPVRQPGKLSGSPPEGARHPQTLVTDPLAIG